MSRPLAHRRLIAHPDFPCPVIEAMGAKLSPLGGGAILIEYVVLGDIAALAVPAEAEPARTDELWRHSCFEAFVRTGEGDAYLEFNLSPSGQWAAYRFDAHRAGMRDLDPVSPPGIVTSRSHNRLALAATIDLGGLVAGTPMMGLSAVIETLAGDKSYWAIAHPAGKPDFHDPACFALELPAPEAA